MKSKYVQRIFKNTESLPITYRNRTFDVFIYYDDLGINIKFFPVILTVNPIFKMHAAIEESKILRKFVYELVREKDLS